MQRIFAKQIKEILGSREDILIINVLPKEDFNEEHIPGSINIPVSGEEDFVQKVEALVTNKSRKIVVYCASKECPASEQAAEKLDKAGFSYVLDFEGGMKEWKNAGEAIEKVAA